MVNSLASKYIWIFVLSILWYLNIFGYLLGPIHGKFYHMLTTLDKFGKFVTNFDLFWLVSVMTNFFLIFHYYLKIDFINYLNSYSLLFLRPHIFGYLFGQLFGIHILLGICSINSWTSKYHRSILAHQNILRYFFILNLWYWLITATVQGSIGPTYFYR